MTRLMKTQRRLNVFSRFAIILITIFSLVITFMPGSLFAGAPAKTQEEGCSPKNTLETGDPISAGGGEFREHWRLFSLGGLIPLDFTLIYAPDLEFKSPVNDGRTQFPNWRFIDSFTSNTIIRIVEFEDRTVEPAQAYINVFVSDDTLVFKDDGTGNFVPVGPEKYQIKKAGDYYYLMDPLREWVYIFRSRELVGWDFPDQAYNRAGEIVHIMDRNNNTLSYTYNNDNLPTQIKDGLGRQLDLEYIADSDSRERHLIGVSDGYGRTVIFNYQELTCNGWQKDVLVSLTDKMNQTTTFDYYDTANTNCNLINKINLPLGNSHIDQSWTQNPKGVDAIDSQKDAYGNETTLSFSQDADSNIITTVDYPDTSQRVFHHERERYPLDVTDPSGNQFTIGYNSEDQMTSITDRLGDTTSFTYHTESGKIASITNARGDMLRFTYAGREQTFTNPDTSDTVDFTFYDLTKIDHPDDTSDTHTYDTSGNLLTWTDPNGSQWTYSYNNRSQVLTFTNPMGGVITYTYNADGTLASEMDNAGNTTTYAYDSMRRLEKITHPDGASRTFTYDNTDNLLTATDERGNTYTFTYDDNNNLTSITNSLGNKTTFAYDPMDRLVSTTNPLGNSQTYTYDELGRIWTETDRNGNTITFGYDACGRATTLTDEEGKIWPITYDAEGIIASMEDPLGNKYTFASNKMGMITQFTRPLEGKTNITYDSMGRITAAQNPLGKTTTFEYDALGEVLMITLPGAITASFTRNALSQITEVTDPNGNVWLTDYDTMGRPTSITDPLGNVISYQYDSRSRISRVNLPASTLDFTYDANGNVTRRLYSDGTDLGYTYDTLDRLTAADGVSLAYDANGMITASNGLAVTRDAGGRIATITLAPGKVVTYTYDSRDLLTSVTDWQGGAITLTQDDAGHLLSITRPNGIDSTYTRDADGRVTRIRHGTIADISLTRDADGQITSATRSVPLDTALTEGTRSFTYNDASHVSTYIYDSLGRLTDDGTRTYTWDLASRLTSHTEGGNTVSFTYDALGNRLSRTAGAAARSYVWNEALWLQSISVEKQVGDDLRYYVHAPCGSLLYSVDAADNSRRFYHYDEIGNTLFITNDAGTVIGSYAYSPYGELIDSTGALDNPFTWQGQLGIMSEGNGLYYMRARYYDSAAGRFISRDLISSISPQKINPYQYAVANSLGYIDPLGEDSEEGFGDYGERLGKKFAKDLGKKALKETLKDWSMKGALRAWPVISFVENCAKIYIQLWEIDSALTDLEGQMKVTEFHLKRLERTVLSMRESRKFYKTKHICDLKVELREKYKKWVKDKCDKLEREIESLRRGMKSKGVTERTRDLNNMLINRNEIKIADLKARVKCNNTEHTEMPQPLIIFYKMR